jgi:hypothetical protein
MVDAASLWATHGAHLLMLVAWLLVVGVVYAVGLVRRRRAGRAAAAAGTIGKAAAGDAADVRATPERTAPVG